MAMLFSTNAHRREKIGWRHGLIALLFTALTMLAFAANSLLCRMALGGELIDPVSFTTIRLASGALVLFALLRFSGGPRAPRSPG